MKQISLYRQVNLEDITELTPRKGTVIVNVQINKPPQLEEVDNKIAKLVDILSVLEQNLDALEQDYFQDIAEEDESGSETGELDESWKNINQEYNAEIEDADAEYQELVKRTVTVKV